MQNTPVVDPANALALFAVGAALLGVCFWPKRGLVARIRRNSRSTERIRAEDALKHLYAVEYSGRSASTESLAGVLEVSRIVAARTIQRLTERGLAVVLDATPTLTDEGRDYATRILRSHRLWERYLADRTGVKPEEWHTSAEEAEHRVTAAEAEALSARLGHPRYDPHGDPIPTSKGEMPPPAGVSLGTVEPGARVEITHLEDEPPELFERITAIGLAPHMRFSVVEKDSESVRIDLRGERVTMPLIVANNVTVRPLKEDETVHGATATLAETEVGTSARVAGIAARCQGPQRRRLLDLGVVPGTEILAELESAGGDPTAYRIRGALIALRKEQASWIEVEPLPEPADTAVSQTVGV
jgi:DtxR family Mn-dependent transcriptional regulator